MLKKIADSAGGNQAQDKKSARETKRNIKSKSLAKQNHKLMGAFAEMRKDYKELGTKAVDRFEKSSRKKEIFSTEDKANPLIVIRIVSGVTIMAGDVVSLD